jgi:broad specificity phosphatase PhoE
MKILEIRRHSIRNPLGEHLNQKGVSLARFAGNAIGPFERVYTSTLPRAFETAIAMGFAVDEQNELISAYGREIEREAPWPQPFINYAEIINQKGAAASYAKKLAQYYLNIMSLISEGGSALVINHGGVVEMGVIGCLPETDFSSWGDAVSYCEGARLFWDEGKFVSGEVLRVAN